MITVMLDALSLSFAMFACVRVCACMHVYEKFQSEFCLLFVTFFFESVIAVTGDLCCVEKGEKPSCHVMVLLMDVNCTFL